MLGYTATVIVVVVVVVISGIQHHENNVWTKQRNLQSQINVFCGISLSQNNRLEAPLKVALPTFTYWWCPLANQKFRMYTLPRNVLHSTTQCIRSEFLICKRADPICKSCQCISIAKK